MLVWIIIWSGLLLLILYSPFGSPDLYTTKKYFTAYQGVQFNGEVIENSPLKKAIIAGNSDQGINIPVYNSTDLNKNATYAVSTTSDNSKADNSSPSTGLRISTLKSSNAAGSGAGIGGNVATFIGKTSKDNAIPQTTGFMSLQTEMDTLRNNNSTNKKSIGYSAGAGATDPGGNDDLGPPIPVGDGWWLLVLCGLYYAFRKTRWLSQRSR